MLILERSVTKTFWEASYRYLKKKVSISSYRKIGTTGVVEIPGGNYSTSYAVLANEAPVAWMHLKARPGWTAHEVTQVFVFPDLRGHGLASRLYTTAINQDGLLLASGKTHTKMSMALWARFIKNDTFNIWAHDFNNLSLYADVCHHQDELYCTLPIYVRQQTKHDVRLLARRKT